jgi:hypothetical protein
VAEASAQSLPIHAVGNRSGAAEAAREFDVLLNAIAPELDTRSSSTEPGSL